MKIASYNIRKCVGLDRRRDPLRVLSVLNDLSPDLAALQEVDLRLGRRPSSLPIDQIERLTGMRPLDFGFSGPSLGWHGNALLVRPDIAVTDIEFLNLPGLEPRGAVIADILNGVFPPVRLAMVHLGLLRKSRKRQIAYIQDAMTDRPVRSTILTGDFNEWSQTNGLGELAKEYNILAPGNSYHAARPVAKLDRFALSKDLRVMDAGVVDKHRARRASDHLPIWVEIDALSKRLEKPVHL